VSGDLIAQLHDDLIGVLSLLSPLAEITAWLVICQGLLQGLVCLAQLVLAYRALRHGPPVRAGRALWWDYSDVAVPIALLVPAYNEEATISESIRSMLSLQYPDFEVIVINDGSKDGTMDALIEAFDLTPMVRPYDESVTHRPIQSMYGSQRYGNLLVIDKENGGKSDALNAGINVSRAPLFCAVDADSLLEPESLLRAVQPFLDDPYRVVAVGGTIRVVNGCEVRGGRVVRTGLPHRLLPLFQTVEYLRAFLMARLAWSELNALTIVSGAFGIFRRSVAVEVGGYTHGTVGEDLEIIIKIHRWMNERGQHYRIRFIPEPVCWTEAPESLRVLARQRMRWQRGALETLHRHRDMILNRRYGPVGVLGLGNALLTDVLGPPFELLGYLLIPLFWATGTLSLEFFVAFLALTFVFGISISVGSLILEEMELRRFPRARDLFVLTLAAILENFGYRQLNNVWRVGGFIQWLRGAKGWGKMTRRGFQKAELRQVR
jgi:cellulose synthase/poly-beta-1,6-N-acetylglucosamine synthase-like glycosyltransferase